MADSPLSLYLSQKSPEAVDAGFVAYLANLTEVASVAPSIARGIIHELRDQRSRLKLIASENYCSLPTQLAMGNLLTDKYAEGFPGVRFYEGCENIDDVEAYAVEQAKKLFGAEHAYVQPHSGADANMVAFWGILQAKVGTPALEEMGVKDPGALSHEDWEKIRAKLGNQRLLGLSLAAGGHLTHGYRFNVSGKMFDAYSYGVSEKDGLLDYDQIEAQAREVKPLILLAGYSAYPRAIDFRRMREIADKVGAVLMVDMAHFAGLVAGGVFEGDYNPIPHAHVVTSTTHKTLRGPRGGIVLSTAEFGEYMDKGCPLVLGGPLAHVMAAKGVAFTEANRPEFRTYARKIVENSKALAQACMDIGMEVVTGGTDNHLFLVDVTPFGITGRQGASALGECSITLNKNAIPFDKQSPMITSGMRIGTAAVTTLGMGADEMKEIAAVIKLVLEGTGPGTIESGPRAGQPSKIKYQVEDRVKGEAVSRVKTLLDRFPVYPGIDLEFLQEQFEA
jgi:glycine hydroxymethyltransferase